MKSQLFILFIFLGVIISCTKENNDDPNNQQDISLTTIPVTNITQSSGTSGGTIVNAGTETIVTKGVCWGENENPTIQGNFTLDGIGNDPFVSDLTGLSSDKTYYVKAYATTSLGTIYGNQVFFTTSSGTINYGTMSDSEGNTYKTVEIGTQTWMAENLKVEKLNDGTDITLVEDSIEWTTQTIPAYCYYYNDEAKYKNLYGAMYNYHAISTGKMCPSGWHVPTKAEWQTLLDYLAANGFNYDGTTLSNKVAVAMSEFQGWGYSTGMGCVGNDDYEHWHNKSGFSARPAGYRMPMSPIMGSYLFSTSRTSWWASDLFNSELGNIVQIDKSNPVVVTTGAMLPSGNSCRCVKD